MLGEVPLCLIAKEMEQEVTITLYLRTKSALTFLGGADSIIQVGCDSLLLCS